MNEASNVGVPANFDARDDLFQNAGFDGNAAESRKCVMATAAAEATIGIMATINATLARPSTVPARRARQQRAWTSSTGSQSRMIQRPGALRSGWERSYVDTP